MKAAVKEDLSNDHGNARHGPPDRCHGAEGLGNDQMIAIIDA